MLRVAFYIGDHKSDAGWRGRFGVWVIRLAQRGSKFVDATHCEIILERCNSGESVIASATMIPENPRTGGNGVRTKQVKLKKGHWRIYEVPGDVASAKALFEREDGKPYDLFGAIASAVNLWAASKFGWFCSRIGAEAIGLPDGAQFTPSELEAVCHYLGPETTNEFFNEEPDELLST